MSEITPITPVEAVTQTFTGSESLLDGVANFFTPEIGSQRRARLRASILFQTYERRVIPQELNETEKVKLEKAKHSFANLADNLIFLSSLGISRNGGNRDTKPARLVFTAPKEQFSLISSLAVLDELDDIALADPEADKPPIGNAQVDLVYFYTDIARVNLRTDSEVIEQGRKLFRLLSNTSTNPLYTLSPKELEVAPLVASEESSKDVA